MKRWWLVIPLLLVLAGCVSYYTVPAPRASIERFATNDGATSGACTTEGSACRLSYVLSMLVGGDILTLLDGTYRGGNNMFDFPAFAFNVSGSASGGQILIRAKNDGAVIIDGEGVRSTLTTARNSYVTFQGFDIANSSGYAVWVNCTPWCGGGNDVVSRIEFKRVIGYRAGPQNNHIWSMGRCLNCLFEDIAGFGRARNIFVEGDSRDGSVVRRAWLRAETQPGEGILTPMQPCYACYSETGATGTSGGMLYENTINVFWPMNPNENASDCAGANYPGGNAGPAPNDCTFHPMMSRRDGHSHIDRYKGMIGYDFPHNVQANCESHIQFFQVAPDNMTDIFVDGRANSGCKYGQVHNITDPIYLANNVMLGDGGGGTGDRFTSIRTSTAIPSRNGWPATNFRECISTVGAIGPTLGGCPNFYTGDTGGSAPFGSRACKQYFNGALTSTPLWPWPMDDRIKLALSRSGHRGLVGSGLSGLYAANTVTSEIVARYGAIPSPCVAGIGPTPNPPAGLTLTQLWQTIWTPLAGIRG